MLSAGANAEFTNRITGLNTLSRVECSQPPTSTFQPDDLIHMSQYAQSRRMLSAAMQLLLRAIELPVSIRSVASNALSRIYCVVFRQKSVCLNTLSRVECSQPDGN